MFALVCCLLTALRSADTTMLISQCITNILNFCFFFNCLSYHTSSLLFSAQRDEFPRITEMSFIALPRETFLRGVGAMKEKSDAVRSLSYREYKLVSLTR